MIDRLDEQIRRLQATRRPDDGRPIASGCAELDRLLPGGGFLRGTLIEWLADGAGSGAVTLAMIVSARICRQGGALVVIDGRRRFYPPPAIALGIDPRRLIVVRPQTKQDEFWATDQALRCGGVAVVLCWPDAPVAAQRQDTQSQFEKQLQPEKHLRRWRLAAEASGAIGMLARPARVRNDPSWADLRLLVEPRPSFVAARRLRLKLLRCRGGWGRDTVELTIDHETSAVYLAAELADSATATAAARAARSGNRSR